MREEIFAYPDVKSSNVNRIDAENHSLVSLFIIIEKFLTDIGNNFNRKSL